MSDKNELTPVAKRREPRENRIQSAQKTGSVQKYPLRKGVLRGTPSTKTSGKSASTPGASKKIPFRAMAGTSKETEKETTDTEDELLAFQSRKRRFMTMKEVMDLNFSEYKTCKKLKRSNSAEDPLDLKSICTDNETPEDKSPKYKTSFVADVDNFLYNVNQMIIDYESLFELMVEFASDQARFREMCAILLKDYQKQKKELERVKDEVVDYSDKLNHARKLLDREKKGRRKVEFEKNCLERQMIMARDLLFSDKCRNRLPEDTREKLAFLNNTTLPSQSSFDHVAPPGFANRLNTINEVNSQELNSTGSLLSDFSYSRSEDDLDVSYLQNGKKWKKFQPSPIIEEPSVKKRRSSGNVVEIGPNEKIVATTTLAVTKDGPIHASSIIESVPIDPLESPKKADEPNKVGRKLIITSEPRNEAFEAVASRGNDLMNRTHKLVQKTMIRPVVCGPCNKRITFGKVIMKCKDCRAVCHPECKWKLPLPCIPGINTPNQKKMSGTITDYVSSYSPMIPALLIHCVNEIELRGLSEVGIYRVPGSERDVKQLKERFLNGKGAPVLTDVDIHVVCGCVKDFLRSLQEPLIPTSLWNKFIDAVDNRLMHEIPPLLYGAIEQLPPANRDTLAYMILHLQKVADAKECLMPIGNLAKVFGPTIVGYSSADVDLNLNILTETRQQSVLMENLLKIPSDYWSNIIKTRSSAETPSEPKISQTPSSSSLQMRTVTKNFFTPLTGNRVRKPNRFFGTPPTK